MIDKKIEEAKEAFIADKKILGIVAINDLACGFKEGAKWGINEFQMDLWHPASEEPMRHSYILFKTANNNGFETEYIDCSWKTLARCFQITQWLYVEDLFPKEVSNEDIRIRYYTQRKIHLYTKV